MNRTAHRGAVHVSCRGIAHREPVHSTVKATAEGDRGYVFAHWVGTACTGTKPTCTVRNLTTSKWIAFDVKKKRT
jgi:hypothetical protein